MASEALGGKLLGEVEVGSLEDVSRNFLSLFFGFGGFCRCFYWTN